MSKIPVHHSLMVAHKVIKEVEKIIPKEIAKECSLESWSNCREQGICISYYPLKGFSFSHKVCIAECRNSDEILVIHGTTDDFDNQTNQPTEETYQKNRKYFRYNDSIGAAKYIVEVLKA
jgi:hypothetical protein